MTFQFFFKCKLWGAIAATPPTYRGQLKKFHENVKLNFKLCSHNVFKNMSNIVSQVLGNSFPLHLSSKFSPVRASTITRIGSVHTDLYENLNSLNLGKKPKFSVKMGRGCCAPHLEFESWWVPGFLFLTVIRHCTGLSRRYNITFFLNGCLAVILGPKQALWAQNKWSSVTTNP